MSMPDGEPTARRSLFGGLFARQPVAPVLDRPEAAKPTVVMLTDIPFWEGTIGSHVRVTAVLRAIGAVADVKIFCLQTVTQEVRAAFHGLGLAAQLVAYQDWERLDATPFQPVLSLDPVLRAMANDSWTQAAHNFLEVEKPDFVFIEYIDRSFLLDAVPPGTRTILDSIDVMSHRTLTFAALDKVPTIPMGAAEEQRLLRNYSAVMAISDHDAIVLQKQLGMRNVVYTPQPGTVAPPPPVRQEARRVLMIGGSSDANVTGLNWFLDQVWPMVSDRLEFHVAGSVSHAIRKTMRNVQVRGNVEDLEKLHQECDIAVNPVFIGGGIKIKTLDAMSYGLPCVTTREGARGLEGAVGTALCVAHTRLEFADHLLRLASDKAMRERLGAASQAYIREHHAPSLAFQDLVEFLRHA